MRLPLRDLDGATLAALIAGFAELGRAWMQYLAADARDEARESPPALLQDMRV
ncbi:hypothetical protein D3C72_2495660 [compost metagenome]